MLHCASNGPHSLLLGSSGVAAIPAPDQLLVCYSWGPGQSEIRLKALQNCHRWKRIAEQMQQDAVIVALPGLARQSFLLAIVNSFINLRSNEKSRRPAVFLVKPVRRRNLPTHTFQTEKSAPNLASYFTQPAKLDREKKSPPRPRRAFVF